MAAELHQQGLQDLLEVFFRGQSPYSVLYIGLATDESLAENATLSSITEVSGDGYQRQALTRGSTDWPTSESTGTYDWKVKSVQVTFAATGTWTTAKTAFLCTVANGTSGRLIASAPLSQPRTLGNGDQLKIDCIITLEG